MTLGLQVALQTLEAGTGAHVGVLDRSRNPWVAAWHHGRGGVSRLLGHVGAAGRERGGTVVLHVALVRLEREPTLVLR